MWTIESASTSRPVEMRRLVETNYEPFSVSEGRMYFRKLNLSEGEIVHTAEYIEVAKKATTSNMILSLIFLFWIASMVIYIFNSEYNKYFSAIENPSVATSNLAGYHYSNTGKMW